jgi:hypothetical protein
VALYDATFSRTPGFVSRRSLPRTIVATGALLLCGAAVVFAVVNFAGLLEYSKESAEEASRPRYQAMRGLGILPIAIIILAVTFGVFAVGAITGSWTRVWVREQTGTPLRKRFEGYHALSPDTFERLHAAFASGDPTRYVPLPEQTRGGDGVAFIWTADADQLAFVGMTWGSRLKTTSNAPLIVLRGRQFDDLDRALRAGLTAPWVAG